ncbi:MAG: MBL fold metallo-hydrolase [Flavobacterium sp.]|uniref:MBL fold metallo-hydrolase n=1 Tax=Flavobacterium sp. TaxID=239 RepID=UPI001B5462F9|nr:MBL fold metallo-hydrolase [Flavobacterium sp.]MBP6146480.1 MBL fold metallo-hydrolase [Flavobacterium sp.]MBP7182660.1 MBL fold metallo-hydrolase [Flavobacterium sp.]MBP7317535.1 MBL fold metallo-hydrolase [Flavobacterium sp.]MBP8886087.1 MBL fold metallo-hydrolase [Flavobacterium sp.]HRL70639.1 MBL fold metallo-hydrolase [Flavobacterium sp.]
MKVKFIGAAGTVTGSKTLIESNGIRILIDCGLFQGIKPLRELNWDPLPVLPSTIDFVLLTHGHLDHCGWLPRLVDQGFKGKIYCTSPTKDIAKLILLDSAKIQEEEAEKANEGKYSKHEIAEPLYNVAQAERVFPLFRVIKINEPVPLDAEIEAVYTNAGHILGACSIALTLENKTLVFSGDIGRDNDVLMYPPTKPTKADYIFLESTYGNRIHPDTDVKAELEMYINNTVKKGGTIIIPSFAVERAQMVMYLLWQLKEEKKIPNIPYIIDTPMGISVLEIFQNNRKWHKLPEHEYIAMCKMFTMIRDYQETIDTIYNKQSKVVIAASGMITGGRVLSYLEKYIGLSETTLIIIGYQAEGTRGRKLLEGAKEIKIRGKYYPVLANILEIESLSAHGDQKDLLNWLSALENKPTKVFLVHGENAALDELRIKINEKYGFDCKIPLMGQEFEL